MISPSGAGTVADSSAINDNEFDRARPGAVISTATSVVPGNSLTGAVVGGGLLNTGSERPGTAWERHDRGRQRPDRHPERDRGASPESAGTTHACGVTTPLPARSPSAGAATVPSRFPVQRGCAQPGARFDTGGQHRGRWKHHVLGADQRGCLLRRRQRPRANRSAAVGERRDANEGNALLVVTYRHTEGNHTINDRTPVAREGHGRRDPAFFTAVCVVGPAAAR